MAVLYIDTKFRWQATGLSPFFFSEEKEKNMNYKESFVIYESVYAQFERMLKADDIKGAVSYIDAVIQYGLYGVLPDEGSPVWLYGLDEVAMNGTGRPRRQSRGTQGGNGADSRGKDKGDGAADKEILKGLKDIHVKIKL